LNSAFNAFVCRSGSMSGEQGDRSTHSPERNPHLVQAFRVANYHRGLVGDELVQAHPSDGL
jgi:hypothetical protein